MSSCFLHSLQVIAVMLGYNGTPICKYGGILNSAGKCVCPTFNNCTENKGVCGSNGIGYINECELKQAACKHQKHLFVFKKGMCGRSYDSHCSMLHCSLNCGTHGLVQDGFGCLSKCECRASQCSSMMSCQLTCDEKGGVVVDKITKCPKCQCQE
ncbi:Tomoregulin-1 [Paramuricea clavata]|uniref:Tomoregulin-1, partial n=1 Tax=Paramuricea clavata TaxID=317549 RepID=A0A6S7GCC0_PARCT|nr:Tomoregulin-1 [Paramuricea clavata]